MKKLLLASILIVLACPAWADDLNVTPDIFPPTVVGTAPCLVTGSLGVGVTGFGIAGGTGILDKGCEQRNYAALLATIGQKDAAKAYLCRTNPDIKEAFDAIGQDCFAPMKEQAPAQTSAQDDQIKAQQLVEMFKVWDASK